ncbi:CdaR family protein [Clostridium sp. B9]|uniref:CdaR family protein n=1 Tax=Clostridium sp. B9 TaxID=3423224 RepID=UPI003D2EC87E
MLKKIEGKNFLVKFICLLLSFSLWLYIINVENPVREYKLSNVPVQVINADMLKEYNLVMVPNQNLTVDLDLEGPSSEIYKVKKDQFKIVVNLGAYVLKEGDNNIPVEIASYPTNINIKNNGFLRVNVLLDKYQEKNLPIESKIKVNTEQGVYADKLSINPQNATVSGAQSLVDKVKFLEVKGEINDVNKAVNMSLPVVAVDADGNEVEDVNISPSKVDISFGVKQSKEVPVNVITTGTPKEGLALKSITPSLTKVNLIGQEDALSKVNFVETSPIDVSQFADDASVSTVLKLPDGVSLASGQSAQINVKLAFSKDVQKEIEVPITVDGELKGYIVETDVKSIKLTLDGPEEDVNKVDASKFKCVADISKLTESGGSVKLNISNPYDNIKITKTDPTEVKVTFKKTDDSGKNDGTSTGNNTGTDGSSTKPDTENNQSQNNNQ